MTKYFYSAQVLNNSDELPSIADCKTLKSFPGVSSICVISVDNEKLTVHNFSGEEIAMTSSVIVIPSMVCIFSA